MLNREVVFSAVAAFVRAGRAYEQGPGHVAPMHMPGIDGNCVACRNTNACRDTLAELRRVGNLIVEQESSTKKPYTAPKLTKIHEAAETMLRQWPVHLSLADVYVALEECSACCLDEPEEVEKVVAALLKRSRVVRSTLAR